MPYNLQYSQYYSTKPHQTVFSIQWVLYYHIVFSTALHLLGFCHLPSEGSVLRDRLPHVLLKLAYPRNQCPSSFLVAGSR